MILDLFKRFSMFKFGQFKKKSDLRGVQENRETEIGRLAIQRRIFFALSEIYYILSGCVPPFWFLGCSIEELLKGSFNLPEGLTRFLNSGKGTPLFCCLQMFKSRVMKTVNLFQVTPETVAQQKTLVDNLYASLMRRIHSDDFESYRQRWAKARALLAEMQGALYFARKEVCHG